MPSRTLNDLTLTLSGFPSRSNTYTNFPPLASFFPFLHIPYPLFKRNPVEDGVDATVSLSNLIESFDSFRESLAALREKTGSRQ